MSGRLLPDPADTGLLMVVRVTWRELGTYRFRTSSMIAPVPDHTPVADIKALRFVAEGIMRTARAGVRLERLVVDESDEPQAEGPHVIRTQLIYEAPPGFKTISMIVTRDEFATIPEVIGERLVWRLRAQSRNRRVTAH